MAVDDSATVAQDDPATAVDVLANDTDIDGGPKAIDSATRPGQRHRGAHRRQPGRHRPDLPAGRRATATTRRDARDTFTYTLDGGSTATVSIR